MNGVLMFAVGMALVIIGSTRRRPDDFLLTAGAGQVLEGLGITIGGHPRAGAVTLTLGALLLWWWLTRRPRRDRARRWLGAKSAAIRAALARRMREAAQPA